MNKFNFNIDNLEDDELLSKSSFNHRTQIDVLYDMIFVDLGLPSGTLWCKYNVGVEVDKLKKASDWYGKTYSWGETEPKNEYFKGVYKFNKNKKYNAPRSILELEDDAAYANYAKVKGKVICTPSVEDAKELLEYTYLDDTRNYNHVSELDGIKLVSNVNKNHIFIPFAGYSLTSIIDYHNPNNGGFTYSYTHSEHEITDNDVRLTNISCQNGYTFYLMLNKTCGPRTEKCYTLFGTSGSSRIRVKDTSDTYLGYTVRAVMKNI